MKKPILSLLAAAVLMVGCKNNSEKESSEAETTSENQTEMQEASQDEWQELSADNLDHWKAFNADSVSDQWQFEDGTIAFTPSEGEREGTENLITKEEYKNFELSLEWKISEGGNSGIMWGVQEEDKFDEPYQTGPEIQILDNERHPDADNGEVRHAGALYDMVAPGEDVTKPAGEWNELILRIDYKENKGSVTLNGTKTTEFAVHGEDWEAMVEKSKFKGWEDFGKAQKGHIALQDHGNKVWYRNIKIKELD